MILFNYLFQKKKYSLPTTAAKLPLPAPVGVNGGIVGELLLPRFSRLVILSTVFAIVVVVADDGGVVVLSLLLTIVVDNGDV